MRLIYLIIFIYISLFYSNLYAQTIVVVNVQSLIDENPKYIETNNQLENSQKKYLNSFKEKENELQNMLEDIESSKLILNDDEINNLIDKYNNQLNNFSILIDKFNLHYENQIIQIRQTLLKEIIILLEDYAIKNNIDLILDSTSYLIASNSIDITSEIKKKFNQINIALKYEEFNEN